MGGLILIANPPGARKNKEGIMMTLMEWEQMKKENEYTWVMLKVTTLVALVLTVCVSTIIIFLMMATK